MPVDTRALLIQQNAHDDRAVEEQHEYVGIEDVPVPVHGAIERPEDVEDRQEAPSREREADAALIRVEL